MLAQELETVLGAAVADIAAEGIAIGAAAGDLVAFACRGCCGDERVDRETVFYGASVTKQIVGLLLARAVDDRAAAADDLVVRWLPELPEWMAPIRLGHLIHHTSGLPDVTDHALGIPDSNVEVMKRLQRLQPDSLPRPGVNYAYNNAGYVLLAEVLAQIHKRPVSEVATTVLFDPLCLHHTRLGGPTVHVAACPDPPGTTGDGGLWTSIADLTTYLQASNTTRFGTAAHHLAETTTHLSDGSQVDYAWGARITRTPHGRLVTHGGSWHNWLAKTVRVPERQIAVAILSLGATEHTISTAGTQLAQVLAYQ